MSKLFFIAVIVIAVLTGILISSYILHLPPAVAITDMITEKLSALNLGGLNIVALLGVGLPLATTAYGWYKSHQDKIRAQTAAIESSQLSQELGQDLTSVTNIKTELEDKVSDLTQLKDNALAQAQSAKDELSTVKTQLDNAMKQAEVLQKINSGTITDLWKNSGGEFWTDPITGEKYKLMNFETITVK